jgi:hypothetical protein
LFNGFVFYTDSRPLRHICDCSIRLVGGTE